MAQVLVRDLDRRVIDRLKKRAARNGRSLEAELREIIEGAASVDLARARRLAAQLRQRFEGRTLSDSAALLAEDRNR